MINALFLIEFLPLTLCVKNYAHQVLYKFFLKPVLSTEGTRTGIMFSRIICSHLNTPNPKIHNP